LSDYRLIEENNKALITWTTSAGFTCEDITIEHGTDTAEMSEIYKYPGVCGSSSKEEKYTYLFRDIVYNSTNYFRINLGRYGTSPLLTIRIVKLDGLNPIVYPNPIQPTSLLVFSNPDRNEAQITVSNALGQQVGNPVNTRGSQVTLSAFGINTPGTYYLLIDLNGIRSRGKFTVL
jgi:hypothetical protein